ncbi:MAG: hypothetical protein QOI55_2690, partial [Actinomycetota bacterium]|nr:hypothetical protein [Actinomycetota bacterium]
MTTTPDAPVETDLVTVTIDGQEVRAEKG